jgi:hypothetical protein
MKCGCLTATLASLALAAVRLTAAPVHLVDEAPVKITAVEPGLYLVDFGRVAWTDDETFRFRLSLPAGMAARVELPARSETGRVLSGGKPIAARRVDGRWVLEMDVTGTVELEVVPSND